MARYKCKNVECSEFDKLSDNYGVWHKYTKDGVVDMRENCPICNQPRDIAVPDETNRGYCTNIAKNGSGNACNK